VKKNDGDNTRQKSSPQVATLQKMKRCPQCNRVETDEALKFCRVDGTPLVASARLDQDSATIALPGLFSLRPLRGR